MTSEGKTEILYMNTGQTIFLKEQNHIAENVENTDFDLLVVELKKTHKDMDMTNNR